MNGLLAEGGSPKRFRNLFGATFGTGFGGGIVQDGHLWIGDNSAGGEIWLLRNKLDPRSNIEEAVSIRAIRRVYARGAGIAFETAPEPKDIFEIGRGGKPGSREGAIEAFRRMGEAAGDALASAITLVDGLVVIGGGLTGAADLFLPALVAEMNSSYETPSGPVPRLEVKAFNLEDPAERAAFVRGEAREVVVPGSGRKVAYDPLKRIGVGLSRLGTSQAVALGAYAFALAELDRRGLRMRPALSVSGALAVLVLAGGASRAAARGGDRTLPCARGLDRRRHPARRVGGRLRGVPGRPARRLGEEPDGQGEGRAGLEPPPLAAHRGEKRGPADARQGPRTATRSGRPTGRRSPS